MITTDKVIEIFCIADDFCAEYENEIQNHQLQAGGTTKRSILLPICQTTRSRF